MDVDYTGKSKGKGKSTRKNKGNGGSNNKGKEENLATTKNAMCAGKEVISHETVGHEQTTTRW